METIKKFFILQYYKWIKKDCPHFCHLCEFYKPKEKIYECNPYEILLKPFHNK